MGCREIFHGHDKTLILQGGELTDFELQTLVDQSDDYKRVEDIPGTCLSIERTMPYDSSQHQIEDIPIYYFQGDNDPNTSLDQAKYHFENQNSPDRQFIEVAKGGHNPFSIHLKDCQVELYKAIAKGNNLNNLLDADGFCKTLSLTEALKGSDNFNLLNRLSPGFLKPQL